ncbi:MAG: DEAD/DEAH box helicase [Bacilli bacterium]|nr:DEAD/DEAH box helicase [Bacilli bacterium]MDD4282831.1 DEAD/DEAH box helicase [Bacilli bacterium]MDD4719115.1 DEAD/DEAH box helicase [Bacilli bacterium]
MNNKKFTELGLSENVLKSIDKLGFDKPSKIQEEIIPLIMEGNDVIGQAQTGTGKTLAFATSILSKINVKTNFVKAIVLTPTRELALQVSEEFDTLNTSSKFNVLAVYGGSSVDTQIKALKKGVDIVVGTPGRVMDLIKRRVLNIQDLEFFVLDEADEMLNMGFLEDIEFIFNKTNANKQVLLFSATMPNTIKKLAEQYMKADYRFISIEATSKTSINVKQYYCLVTEKTRIEALCRVLDLKSAKLGLIFCQTKRDVDRLVTELSKRNYSVEAMHGDIAQNMRIQTLERFKMGAFRYLIATDVAARGIHVDNITCVINYNLPQDIESYIHRIGRTGRVNNEGEAITLATSREVRFLNDIEKFANCKIDKQELPQLNDIYEAKYQNILNSINEVVEDKEHTDYIKYVRDMNKDDLMRFSAGLLKVVFEKELGSDFNKDLKFVEKISKSDSNSTRVFLTIGKMDNLKRGTLLDFLKDVTKVDKDNFTNIEILTKFTFMDVDNKVVDEVIKKIYNKKLNNRVVRAEKAKRI